MSTVVLLCGVLCDAAVWRHQNDALRTRHKVHICDFRGFDSLSAMAQSVLTDVPGNFALAGHSMGGRVALEIMRAAPQRVERLALLDTGFEGVGSGEAERRSVLLNQSLSEGIASVAEAWMLPMLALEHREHPTITREILDMVINRMSAEIYAGHTRALLNRQDATDVLGTIRCPTLVLCGEQDGWSPPDQHRKIAAQIPGSTLKLIDHCGHMSMMEQPEAVTSALIEWLG